MKLHFNAITIQFIMIWTFSQEIQAQGIIDISSARMDTIFSIRQADSFKEGIELGQATVLPFIVEQLECNTRTLTIKGILGYELRVPDIPFSILTASIQNEKLCIIERVGIVNECGEFDISINIDEHQNYLCFYTLGYIMHGYRIKDLLEMCN